MAATSPMTTHANAEAGTGVKSEAAPRSRSLNTIMEILQSGRPLVYIRTAEEDRIADLLREAGHELNPSGPIPVWTWSLTEGLSRDGESEPEAPSIDPREALDFIAGHEHPAIFHLKDFHGPLHESAAVRRRLRDLYRICLDKQKFIVITSPLRSIPDEVERSFVLLELPPPDLAELLQFLRSEAHLISAREGHTDTSDETLHLIGRALQGLSLDEARHAVRRALAISPNLGAESLPALFEEKKILINRSGAIEFVSDSTNIGAVGGLENLKKWLNERRKLFQQRDSLSADIVPKGLLLMGIPGCGKSLSVRAIASCFELPLYRIDMIDIFSGRHGKAEGAFVEACRLMEDMAPAVLWFDEIEMGINSTESAGEQGRMFAFFLTWMQEKAKGLFVAATANRIDLLPAEMIRKGRFDEVFFVDLPTPREQMQIFEIHLKRLGVDPARFQLDQLHQFTVGWTGAEIEQCVISAVTRAQLEEREVKAEDLIGIAAKLVPLSRTMKEQIEHIRSWAFERAVRASPAHRL